MSAWLRWALGLFRGFDRVAEAQQRIAESEARRRLLSETALRDGEPLIEWGDEGPA